MNALAERSPWFKGLTEAVDTKLGGGFREEAIRVGLETKGTLAVE
ncbi:hypothetical protein N6H14_06765 [Paenibacillus sp. CC-CFT747]|nr:hypothetical protein N6H14_06765 [Paenibacillus sp. CC-CFT747]